MRYNTARFALCQALRSPDPFFETVLRAHWRMRHDAICQTLQAWRQEVKEKTSQSLGGGQQGGIHRVFFSRVPTIARFLPPDDDDDDDDEY